MVEIRERNPKLRLFVNIALTAIFAIFLAYFAYSFFSHRSVATRIVEEIKVFEKDYMVKQKDYVALEADINSKRESLSPQQMVQESLKLQELGKKIDVLRQSISTRKENLEQETGKMNGAVRALIITFVLYAVVMWINYILNY